ncbi:flagellar protein FlgN [Alkalicoccus daliensis]|nr:flagellar protein FlgN [Alkalicoccus daliensis]
MTEDLKKIFQALIVVHKRLNEQALLKEEIVKKGDIPALDQLMKDEMPLVTQLSKLENARRITVRSWLKEQGVVAEDATMEQISPAFSQEEQEMFRELQEALIAEVEQLQEQNELNRQLLEDSLRFVNLSLDAVQPQKNFASYSGKGESGEDDEQGRSLFDSKA